VEPAVEKLLTPEDASFRCFNRQILRVPARWHHHPEFELTFVETGTGTRVVGDSIATYRDRDLVLVGPHLPHMWQSDEYLGRKYDRHAAVVIQFSYDFLGSRFFEVPELSNIRVLLERSMRGIAFSEEIAAEAGRLMIQMVDQPPATRLVSFLNCLCVLADDTSATVLASPAQAKPGTSSVSSRTEKVCNYIYQRFRDPELTHRDIAKHASMNPSAFSRFFRQSTGKTPTHYINELRIGLACRLLIDTDQSISTISLESGFNNLSHFHRRFREFKSMTPREFRKRYRTDVATEGISAVFQ